MIAPLSPVACTVRLRRSRVASAPCISETCGAGVFAKRTSIMVPPLKSRPSRSPNTAIAAIESAASTPENQ